MLRIVDSGSMSAFEMWVAKVTHPVRLATSPTGKAKGVGDQNCDGTGAFRSFRQLATGQNMPMACVERNCFSDSI